MNFFYDFQTSSDEEVSIFQRSSRPIIKPLADSLDSLLDDGDDDESWDKLLTDAGDASSSTISAFKKVPLSQV